MFGGKWMDTFMDKLAQKLTAQEMIKANTVAEMEEVNGLREQVRDYKECLDKLEKLIDRGMEKIATVQENAASVDLSSVTEAVEGLASMKDEISALQEKVDALPAQLTGSQEAIHKECVKVYRNVQAVVVEETARQAEEITNRIKEAKKKATGPMIMAALAFLASLAGVAFQVLLYLHII